MDRLVQASLVLVLEPIFEADFKPVSYGFRPERRAQDAIAEIHHFGSKGYHWVFEADITACFDELSGIALSGSGAPTRRRQAGPGPGQGIPEGGHHVRRRAGQGTVTGTPQGGIASPLLANIALSALDEHFCAKWDAHGTQRQADSTPQARRSHLPDRPLRGRFRDHGARLPKRMRTRCGTRSRPCWPRWGFACRRPRSRVCHLDEGFDFLGLPHPAAAQERYQRILRLHLSVEEGVGLDHGQGAGGHQ